MHNAGTDFDQLRAEIARDDSTPKAEKEYRLSVLRAIEKRISENGPRIARQSPERARQFMPFSALKGYEELIEETARTNITRTGETPSPKQNR